MKLTLSTPAVFPARWAPARLGARAGKEPMMKTLRGASAGRFTLIELLVVIAIITILMSLLLPGLKHARETAMTIRCLGNMKSAGQGIAQYTVDYQDFIPPPNDWCYSVRDYTGLASDDAWGGNKRPVFGPKNIFWCDKAVIKDVGPGSNSYGYSYDITTCNYSESGSQNTAAGQINPHGYVAEYYSGANYSDPVLLKSKKINRISGASILIGEVTVGSDNHYPYSRYHDPAYVNSPYNSDPALAAFGFSFGHQNNCCALAADGQVRVIRRGTVINRANFSIK
jgi:prepilin-type N-terminal cleavage/methylation domain-containing protein